MVLHGPFGCPISFIYRDHRLLLYCKWPYFVAAKQAHILTCGTSYCAKPLCWLMTCDRSLLRSRECHFLACAKPSLLSFNHSTHTFCFILLIKDWFHRFGLEVKPNWNGLTLPLLTYSDGLVSLVSSGQSTGHFLLCEAARYRGSEEGQLPLFFF